MATANQKVSIHKKADLGAWGVAIPYVIAIAAQLPMLLLYFSRLWNRPHYQFFPIALVMVAIFAWIRWPRNEPQPFFASTFSTVMFWIGIGFGLLGTVFAEPWLAAASMTLLVTSLFARTRDGEFPGKSLISLALPLFVILALPKNLDFWLITNLQIFSASMSSWYLDLLNFKHYSPGTTLNFPGQAYEVERACSGVQSFFTLVFCATFIIVAFRRGFFRGAFLILSAVFWAVLMNSVRIMVIPIAQILFGLDLKGGLAHELLGYGVMLLACAMLLSTDQLMEYLFGRRTITDGSERRPLIGRRQRSSSEDDRVLRKPVSGLFRRTVVVGAGLMLVLGLFQVADVVRSLSKPGLRVRFFDSNAIIDVEPDCMPQVIESSSGQNKYSWELVRHDRLDRTHGSDLGQRSDKWIYRSKSGFAAYTNIDQPFPGWHELTTCYKNDGWRFASLRRVLSEPLTLENGEVIDWTFVEVELKHPASLQTGFLMFCFCDGNGQPFEAPPEWDQLSSFVERARNRLSPRIRSNLFRGQAYQLQVFIPAASRITEPYKAEMRTQFFQVRQRMREALMRYGDADQDSGSADPVAPDEGGSLNDVSESESTASDPS